jgi:hypothetical protein
MRSKIITLFCVGLLVFLPTTYIHAQDTSGYFVIFGNRDASPIPVGIGDTVDIPIWGATARNNYQDSIGFMHIPLATNDSIIVERMGGNIIDTLLRRWDDISFLQPDLNSPEMGWTNQSLLGFHDVFDPYDSQNLFWTDGDTVLLANYRMRLSENPELFGRIVCPFREGMHPQFEEFEGLLWGNQIGTEMYFPKISFSCLAFDTLCHYTPGDINDNGETNGLDVTYAVVYFKGGAVPPMNCYPFCQDAPNPFYAAGDVNASCSFNGLDVTYFVSWLKGGPNPLSYCPDCPPVGRGPD